MSTPILATKLYIPPARTNLVLRPRLIERLDTCLQRKLTLISAPAGFGKTTLVSEWIQRTRQENRETGRQEDAIPAPVAIAWLSLDEGDNDPTRFLTYFIAALQTVAPHVGKDILALLQSSQPPAVDVILTALLNEISAIPSNPSTGSVQEFILVLDDYHLLDAQSIDQALTFLLDHLPPQLHLVITTREDPHLPLARLRARGQLTELRAADLRFTAVEAASFLNQVMDLSLSATDIAALEDRTEGWIAGLQLAALSLQGRPDVPGFIQTFAGDNRYILDYLVEEVLQRQPAAIHSFLLQTAILDHLNGPLCDAVTSQEGGRARLEALERGNFFVIPLDDKRYWYRYHHLFAEVLQAHLRAEQPALVSTLHQRASEWYEHHDLPADAIRHALAAEDFERAANLVELEIPAMRQSRQETLSLGWLRVLPDEVIRYRPVLSVHYAGALLQSGELKEVENRLRDAERWLDRPADGSAVVIMDQAEFRRLPGWLAIYRAAHALMQGDVPATVTYAQQALDLVPADEHPMSGAAAAILGLTAWASGDLDAAYRMYADGMAHLQLAGNISDTIGGAIALADIRIAQGRLHEAMGIYEQGLQLALAHGDPVLRGTADMHVGMSELYRESDELNRAKQHLLRSKEQGEHTGFPQNPYRWQVAMARIKESEGDLDGALALLQEAERLYASDFYPNVRPVAALKARVWLAQGQLEAALDWAREQNLSVQDDLSYLREFDHITLARVLLARYRHGHVAHSLSEAMRLLERLQQAAEAGGRMGRAIEILVLRALTYHAQDDTAAALLPLKRALTLAEPEGYARIFVDEGEALRLLILDFQFWIAQQPSIEQNRKLSIYSDKLLVAFGNEQASADESSIAEQSKIQNPKSHLSQGESHQNLVEPLSDRELDVLRLFTTELSGPEIAHHLMIGLSTVRTHTKSIYSKLNVNSRRAAVKRAAELGLL